MAGNVLVNTAIGAVPVAGDLFSVWFKSNARNYDLLRKHANAQRHSTRGDWTFVAILLGVIGAVLILALLGMALVIKSVAEQW